MNIDILKGLRLESCRLSKGSYELEFEGKKEGKYYNFTVGTSFYLSFLNDKKDICENFSREIWDILETDLLDIIVDSNQEEIELIFENGKKIFIWGEPPLIDNLLMIRNIQSGEWFMV